MSGEGLRVEALHSSGVESINSFKTHYEQENTQPKKLRDIVPFYTDTCQQWTPQPACPSGDVAKLHAVEDSKKASIGSFLSWVWSWFTGTSEEALKSSEVASVDPAPAKADINKRHPRLPSPEADEISLESLISKMNHNMKVIEEMDEDTKEFLKNNPSLSERALFLSWLDGIVKQRENHTVSAQLTTERVLHEQEVKRDYNTKLHEKMKEQQEVASQSVSVGWFSSVLTIGMLILSGVGVIAGIGFGITAGLTAALKVVAGVGGVVSAVGGGVKGVTLGVRAHLEHKNGKFQSEMYGIRNDRNVSHKKIETCLTELREAQTAVNQSLSNHGKAIRSWADASRYRQ